jgi:polysaccharide biosynthesis transport protein
VDTAAYAAPDGGDPTNNFRRYIAAVLRYKWWIIILTVVGTSLGVVASRLVAPEYEAQATIWVETAGRNADRTGPIRSEGLLESSSWVELLRSYVVLDPVVVEKKMFVTPANPADSVLLRNFALEERFAPGRYRLRINQAAGTYALETTTGAAVERGVIGEPVGAVVGFKWTPELELASQSTVEFTVVSPRDVAVTLGRRIQTDFDRNSRFLRVRLRGQDGPRTAAILNHLIERFVEVAAELKRAQLQELVEILDEQLLYAERNLRESEIALEGFRVQTVTLPADRSTPVTPGLQATRDPVFTNYFEMRIEVEQIRRSQDAIRRAIDPRNDQTLGLQTLEAVEAVQRSTELTTAIRELATMNAELRALRYRYTTEHPPVRQLMADIQTLERTTIPALATALLDELQARERQLEERLAGASTELRQIPPRMIEEARLNRAVAIADNLYTTLQRRFEEARLAAVSSVPDVRVLDPAIEPRQPLGDQSRALILLALAGSLGLGLLGAILLDRTDSRVRYPEQVTHGLGLTILGAIPVLKGRRGLISEGDRNQVQEAFRTLRLNLTHAYGTAGPIVLTVTSPGPGDGKSFVTGNLGVFFATLGRRTVVVDGDVRRGGLHHLLGTKRVPGLTEHLRGRSEGLAPLKTDHENLWFIPSGTRRQDAPELLNSKAMRDLIIRLRAEFDVILVDSPPLGAGVDPFVLGTLTGNMVVVLRTGTTDRELADAKLEVIDRLPIRLLGAVLNGVPATREYRYYAYVDGYAALDEGPVEAPVALPR